VEDAHLHGGFVVQRAHLGPQLVGGLAHLSPESRKSALHLAAELHDLRFYGSEPDRHILQLIHLSFENLDLAFQIDVGHLQPPLGGGAVSVPADDDSTGTAAEGRDRDAVE
jgi:hypothetical protein